MSVKSQSGRGRGIWVTKFEEHLRDKSPFVIGNFFILLGFSWKNPQNPPFLSSQIFQPKPCLYLQFIVESKPTSSSAHCKDSSTSKDLMYPAPYPVSIRVRRKLL
ncbi:hypothetical protein ACKWTF_014087 [Chironomus riparius]